MCSSFIRVRFYLETIYLFLIQFILNELSSSRFLTSEIFVKISSLKSLTTYHPKNRKIFRLSRNLMKFDMVARFPETNSTVLFVSSSDVKPEKIRKFQKWKIDINNNKLT